MILLSWRERALKRGVTEPRKDTYTITGYTHRWSLRARQGPSHGNLQGGRPTSLQSGNGIGQSLGYSHSQLRESQGGRLSSTPRKSKYPLGRTISNSVRERSIAISIYRHFYKKIHCLESNADSSEFKVQCI